MVLPPSLSSSLGMGKFRHKNFHKTSRAIRMQIFQINLNGFKICQEQLQHLDCVGGEVLSRILSFQLQGYCGWKESRNS